MSVSVSVSVPSVSVPSSFLFGMILGVDLYYIVRVEVSYSVPFLQVGSVDSR